MTDSFSGRGAGHDRASRLSSSLVGDRLETYLSTVSSRHLLAPLNPSKPSRARPSATLTFARKKGLLRAEGPEQRLRRPSALQRQRVRPVLDSILCFFRIFGFLLSFLDLFKSLYLNRFISPKRFSIFFVFVFSCFCV